MIARVLMSGLILVLATAVPMRSGADEGDDSLERRLMPLIDAHKGTVAVAVKNLKTGDSFTYHADNVMPTASLIKFPVMMETYRQAKDGKVDMNELITLKKEDQVPGSGILTYHFSPGLKLSLRDAVHLMIVYSDNTATNLVLDQIGIKSTADTMEKMGYPNTKVHSKVFKRETTVFPERSKEWGLGSTTPNEMIRLCEALWDHDLVSTEASEAMLEHMRKCDDKDKMPRFLPPGTKVAFKTGSLDAAKTEAGIIETPGGPVAICVMTNDNEDKRWVTDNAGNRLCAEIPREVYEYFKTKPTGKEKAAEGR